MNITVSDQLFVFTACAICGALIGFIFDIFRIIRRLIPTRIIAATIEDLIYWVVAAVLFFLVVLGVNKGEFRLYQFIGVLIGTILYFISISKYIIKFSVVVIRFLTKVLAAFFKIIFTPVLFIFKLLKKPFFFVLKIGSKSGNRLKHKMGINISNFRKFIKKI